MREKISEEFNILKIVNHNSDKYLETEQNTCSMIIQKKPSKPLYELKIHDMTIFNSTENINKIEELKINNEEFNLDLTDDEKYYAKNFLTLKIEDITVVTQSQTYWTDPSAPFTQSSGLTGPRGFLFSNDI